MQIIRARETGSSPQVRGSLSHRNDSPASCGIIPAGAGLTSVRSNFQKSPWDHPRGCGAHPPSGCTIRAILGSSPRVRGSHLRGIARVPCRGIIPAGAGLTLHIAMMVKIHGDHPRGCGAHVLMMIFLCAVMGSSPRVRGSLSSPNMTDSARGIIPAGAGLTLGNHKPIRGRRDHPRGCGAHASRSISR